MSAYALARAAQIKKNRELLFGCGLPTIIAEINAIPEPTPKVKKVRPPKITPSPKTARKGDEAPAAPLGTRSSGRIKSLAEKKDAVEVAEAEKALRRLESDYESEDEKEGEDLREGAAPKSLSGYRPNPKIFGHQKGVPVGKVWNFRMEASQAGVHAPVVAGISGNEAVGAWSIALSGGYEDDLDLGMAFTFTGSGGRDLKGTKAAPKNLRTAPQSSDQEFTAVNAALKKSSETGKPVRVIRGFKGKSCFAPESGYRYDGLYRVTKAWQDVGESGFKVCRYAFVRLDGQPEIPVQKGREEEAAAIMAQYGAAAQEEEESPSIASPSKKRKADSSPSVSPSKKEKTA